RGDRWSADAPRTRSGGDSARPRSRPHLPRGARPRGAPARPAPGVSMETDAIRYKRVDIDGVGVAYREAGPRRAPALLLLHGFPTSGHMFRKLVPKLADRDQVVAPDLPGVGQSDLPSRHRFEYTFSNLARVIARFTEALDLHRFAMYVFDYGSPTGLRLAVKHPERVTAIITQNGNAYVEGLSDGWNPIRA